MTRPIDYATGTSITDKLVYSIMGAGSAKQNWQIVCNTAPETVDTTATVWGTFQPQLSGSGMITVSGGIISVNGGAILNSYLANSGVTIGSTAVSLGGGVSSISGLTLASPTFSGNVTHPDGGVFSAGSNILQANVGIAATPSAWSGGGIAGVVEFPNHCAVLQGSGALTIMQGEYYNGSHWLSYNASGCASLVFQNGIFYFQTVGANGGSGATVTQATVCQIANNGNVTNSNNSYGAISDPDLKQDIALAGSQWDDVKALAANTVKYRLKNNPDGPHMLGFVSRDVGPIKGVREISPGLVAQSTDRDGSTFDHVQYSIAHMKAFKALGEALVRIEALEATIASLHPEKGV